MNKAASFEDDKTWWLQLGKGVLSDNVVLAIELDIPSAVLLPELQDVQVLTDRGEYRAYRGSFDGRDVSVVYHGSGAFSMIGAIEELGQLGVKRLIRVGSCGGISRDVRVGDVIIAEATVRDDRIMLDYVPAEYPAYADHRLVRELARAAEEEGLRAVSGLTLSTASFYPGSGYPTAGGVFDEQPYRRMELWKKLGILGVDIETSSVLVLSRLFGMQGASVLGVSNHSVTGEGGYLGEDYVRALCRAALSAAVS